MLNQLNGYNSLIYIFLFRYFWGGISDKCKSSVTPFLTPETFIKLVRAPEGLFEIMVVSMLPKDPQTMSRLLEITESLPQLLF